jgi:hypothetical protein
MYLADAKLRDSSKPFFTATFDPAQSDMLFQGSGHSFDELAALADASKPVPRFDLSFRLKADVRATRSRLSSPNIAARLEGSDPNLKSQYVAISAHLDHLGVGAPVKGDKSTTARWTTPPVWPRYSILPTACTPGPRRGVPSFFCSSPQRRKAFWAPATMPAAPRSPKTALWRT